MLYVYYTGILILIKKTLSQNNLNLNEHDFKKHLNFDLCNYEII